MKPVEFPMPSAAVTSIVLIGRNHRGGWVAQEQGGRYGGLFVDRAQALKYALAGNGYRPAAIIETACEIELDLGRKGGRS